jgi:hypothetical protein
MSEIKVDSLTGKTSAGNITVTSEGGAATMQLQQGLAKAWANFNGEGTAAILDSINTASLTDSGTGKFSINFSNAMANVYYVFTGLAFHSSASGFNDAVCISRDNTQLSSVSTTVNPFYTFRVEGNQEIKDCKENMVTFDGDLA